MPYKRNQYVYEVRSDHVFIIGLTKLVVTLDFVGSKYFINEH
jgi:hypothetical protein